MAKMIWILGSPRSGTSFLCDYIGKYTDQIYNEPWKSHPLEAPRLWKFPDVPLITFKYCENWKNLHVLMNKWPDSVYVHVWRDPDNVVQSMAFPKEDSVPPRNLYGGHTNEKDRVRLCMQRWFSNSMHCLSLINILPKDQYLEVQYENMKPGLKKLFDRLDMKVDLSGLPFKSKNIDTNLDWDLNPVARQLRNITRNYVKGNNGEMLAEWIQVRRPKFLQRVVL